MGRCRRRVHSKPADSRITRKTSPPNTTTRRRSRWYFRVWRWTLIRSPKMWERERSSWFTPQWAPMSSTIQLEPMPPMVRLCWMVSWMKPLGRYGYICASAPCSPEL